MKIRSTRKQHSAVLEYECHRSPGDDDLLFLKGLHIGSVCIFFSWTAAVSETADIVSEREARFVTVFIAFDIPSKKKKSFSAVSRPQ